MSLEEIETKVAGLLQEEVIVNLKSSVWKERLEGEEKLISFRIKISLFVKIPFSTRKGSILGLNLVS